MNYIDPTSLINFFKFGYGGDTIDLIYLIIIGYLVFRLCRYILKRIIKGVFK